MHNNIISIIIPVYNSEMYFQKCIDSVINQTYKDLEIIIIDDGSDEVTKEFLNKIQSIDERIAVYHKTNGGVSSARNLGLKIAKGEYITFLDSDDYIESAILEKALKKLKELNVDAVQWNNLILCDDNLLDAPPISEKIVDINDIPNIIVPKTKDKVGMIRSVWGKIYKQESLNGLFFNEELYIGEDAIFVIDFLKKGNKIALINEYGYIYRNLESSAVHRYKTDLFDQCAKQMKVLENADFKDKTILTYLSIFAWSCFNDIVDNVSIGIKKGEISNHCAYNQLNTWINNYNKKCNYIYLYQSRKILFLEYILSKILIRKVFIKIILHIKRK